jgi:hypothetical protein
MPSQQRSARVIARRSNERAIPSMATLRVAMAHAPEKFMPPRSSDEVRGNALLPP